MIISDQDHDHGVALPSQMTHLECCMCGDAGLSDELLRCKVCKFRSQHRYCSNVYPKAKSYRICNWCLSEKKEASRQKGQDSSNSGSSSCKSKNNEADDHKSKRSVSSRDHKSKRSVSSRDYDDDDAGGLLTDQRKRLKLQLNNSAIKKQAIRSPEKSSGERINLSNNKNNNAGIIKRGTRNRVRRYKLLEEVAC